MALIIRHRKPEIDSWKLHEAGADLAAPGLAPHDDVIVTPETWRTHRAALAARASRIGILVGGETDPESFAADLPCFGVVAVRFPKFSDGRGFSLAHLLRTRYGYRGELRAVGDICRDQLPFLEACGFDTYVLREGEDPVAALTVFDAITEAYQASAMRPGPFVLRRAATAGSDAAR